MIHEKLIFSPNIIQHPQPSMEAIKDLLYDKTAEDYTAILNLVFTGVKDALARKQWTFIVDINNRAYAARMRIVRELLSLDNTFRIYVKAYDNKSHSMTTRMIRKYDEFETVIPYMSGWSFDICF